MKYITYIAETSQLDMLDDNCAEVVLATKLFSQVGKLSIDELKEIAATCESKGIDFSLEWDILMTQSRFGIFCEQFKKIANLGFKSVRLRDPGAINHILNVYKDISIDLHLDSGGHHNIESLRVWHELLGTRLRKAILSIELSSEVLGEFCNYLKKQEILSELLVLGRISLFYTPRNLVSPLYSDSEEELGDYIEVKGSSEESPHKGFPIIENQHGTFMFNTKDQYLLEYLDEIEEIGINHTLLDFSGVNFEQLTSIQKLYKSFDKASATTIKNEYPNSTTRGFFHVNKSDVLFKKLKNKLTVRSDEDFVGEVVDVVKKSHIAILVKSKTNNLVLNKEVSLHTPDGKVKSSSVGRMNNTSGQELTVAQSGEIVMIPHVSGISVKTMVYLAK